MPNDVSYFKVPGDSNTYAFNDANAESGLAAETTRAQAAEQANASAIAAMTANLGSFASGTLTISSRNSIPVNYIGGVRLADGAASSVLPTSGVENLVAFGFSDNNRALLVSAGNAVYYSAKVGGTWGSWVQVTLSS